MELFIMVAGSVVVVAVAGLVWGLCQASAAASRGEVIGHWDPKSSKERAKSEKLEADRAQALVDPSPELRELEKHRHQASVDLNLPGPNASSFALVNDFRSLLTLHPSDSYHSWTKECDNLRKEVKAVQAANGAAIAGDLFGRIKTCLETLVEAAVDEEGRCPPLFWDMPRPKLGGFHKDRNWAQQTIKWLNDRPVHPSLPSEEDVKKSTGITPEMKEGTKEESEDALAEVTREIESIVKTKALEIKTLHLGREFNGLLYPNGEYNPGVVPQPDDAPYLLFLYVKTLGVLKETMASKDEHWISLDDRVSTLQRLKALANGLANALHSVSTWLGPKAASGLASRILRDAPNPTRAFVEDALEEYLVETEQSATDNPIEFNAEWSDRNWDLPRSSEASATNPSNVVYPDERNN